MRLPTTSAFLFTTLFTTAALAQTWPATDPGHRPPVGPAMNAAGEVFGDKGQLVFTSDFDIDFRKSSMNPPDDGDSVSQTALTISPTVDFFLAKNLSLGGTVILDRLSIEGNSWLTFQVGPQVGYNLALGSALTIWPRVGLLWSYGKQDTEVTEGTGNGLSLTAFAPVLFHPAPHFFIGIGPRVSVDLRSKWEGNDGAKTTVYGLDFLIGGWL